MWIEQHLDTIVYDGDTLYRDTAQSHRQGKFHVLLNDKELPKSFAAFDNDYQQNVMHTGYGVESICRQTLEHQCKRF